MSQLITLGHCLLLRPPSYNSADLDLSVHSSYSELKLYSHLLECFHVYTLNAGGPGNPGAPRMKPYALELVIYVITFSDTLSLSFFGPKCYNA